MKIAFSSDFRISMRVVPQSVTAIEYLSLPESYAIYNVSRHASHVQLTSMYSPSPADFLSVESVSLEEKLSPTLPGLNGVRIRFNDG